MELSCEALHDTKAACCQPVGKALPLMCALGGLYPAMAIRYCLGFAGKPSKGHSRRQQNWKTHASWDDLPMGYGAVCRFSHRFGTISDPKRETGSESQRRGRCKYSLVLGQDDGGEKDRCPLPRVIAWPSWTLCSSMALGGLIQEK